MQYDVFCHICGHQWAEQDPGVRFILTDHVWECTDESDCFDRRAMADHELLQSAIQSALDEILKEG